MKKDFRPVSSTEATLPEVGRVAAQWTAVWKDQAVPSIAELDAVLARREEYTPLIRCLRQAGITGGRVLDAGCGMGEWSLFLNQHGFDVYGVDISQDTIARLQARFPRIHFQCADIRHLEFPEAFFDACISWGVFEHFENGVGACLRETRRVLRDGGYLLLTVPFHNLRHIWRDAKPLAAQGDGYDTQRGYAARMLFYQWRFTTPELERELAMGGFRVLSIRPIHFDEGFSRMLTLDFHLPAGTRRRRFLGPLLRSLTPRRWVAHMLFAIAQKR